MVKLPTTQRKHNHAKKEKRIPGGIPEEEPRKIEAQIEIEGRAGKAQSTPQAQAICQQL